jgi:hypothetical protein
MSSQNPTPKIILVTGGGRGLGRNTAISAARSGFDVIITYHSTCRSSGNSRSISIASRMAFVMVRIITNNTPRTINVGPPWRSFPIMGHTGRVNGTLERGVSATLYIIIYEPHKRPTASVVTAVFHTAQNQ